MLKKRIVPALDMMGGKVVKSVNFINFSEIGDPLTIAKAYESQGADEIVFLDITATHEKHDTHFAFIKQAASELNIPVTAAGGIRGMEDIRKLFDCGAEKISITSAAVLNPDLIKRASDEFGSERIIVAVDCMRVDGRYKLFIKGGRENTGLDLVEYLKKFEALGAGEIMVNSMDGDGTQNGYDIEMTKTVMGNVNIPVIASGGCGEVKHIIEVFRQTDCAAALVASMLHYGKATIGDIKRELEKENIPC